MTKGSPSLDARLRYAIAHKRLVEVRYHGSIRVAEPHDYGMLKGVERLLAFQLRGPARAPQGHGRGWRLLDVATIDGLTVLDQQFTGSRGRSHRHHLHWDVLYARVT